MKVKNKAELLLALLYGGGRAGAGSVEGITRLEKLLFLLQKEAGSLEGAPPNDRFNFFPFRMGPWTEEVYDEVDFLESLGLLERRGTSKRTSEDAAHDEELFGRLVLDKYQRGASQGDDKSETFALTAEGLKKAKDIWDRLPDEERKRILDTCVFRRR